jgi:hypothetical protein
VRFATRAGSYNHWWLKTDPDVRPAKQWVLAYHLKRWGNDELRRPGRPFIRGLPRVDHEVVAGRNRSRSAITP